MPRQENDVLQDTETSQLISSIYSDIQSLWNQRKALQRAIDDPRAAINDFERFYVAPEYRVNEFRSGNFGLIPEPEIVVTSEQDLPEENPLILNIRQLPEGNGDHGYFLSVPHKAVSLFAVIKKGSGILAITGSPRLQRPQAELLEKLVDQIKKNALSSSIEDVANYEAPVCDVFFADSKEVDVTTDIPDTATLFSDQEI